MKSKIERIFIILLIILALWNVYNVYECYKLCIPNGFIYDTGLGIPTFNIFPSVFVVILQIINIILLVLILKEKNSRKKLIYIL